ncbi:LOW QUALITY PROTEIN: sialin-like [Portunus trituberculatus]|uniref:LOW QUALITY PROTEIN: sialin-like n=1 Tax=Portunus trituberculatus TaxID=210409 RepID=UPI001E1CF78C|nr:LOW QUALITY PROTEIN: sialin-like [Portunus trituberculatus]
MGVESSGSDGCVGEAKETGRRVTVNDGLVLTGDLEVETNKGAILSYAAESSHTAITSSDTSSCSWWNARNALGVLIFLGLMVAFLLRVALSITIVAMVTRNVTVTLNNDTCPVTDEDLSDSYVQGEFAWDDQTQSIILGAFFYGYTATNFIGGRAAEYLGGRLMFGLGIVIPSILTLFSPLCIYTSPNLFIALRVLEGLTQGMVFPSVHLMIAAWIPPKDKAKYSSFVISGSNFGTVLAMSVGGWLCNTTFLGGWPSVFYIFGGLGVIWGILWFLFAHDLPEHHPKISRSELQYILDHRYYVKRDKVEAIPWQHIVTSVPFWAIMAASFCDNFSFYTLLTELPTYFSNMLHFDIASNGLRSALPYAIQCVTSVLWGIFINALHSRNYVSLGMVRKLSTSIALYVSAAGLVAMIWVECDPVWAIIVMCLSVSATGPINSGSALSEQDIAPNFAGTLKGLTNTLGSATGFLAPAVTGAIIKNNQTLKAWNTVFIISASFNVFFCSIFVIFGTAKVQSWNYPQPRGHVIVSTIPNIQ